MKMMIRSLLLSALMIAAVSTYAQKGEENIELKSAIQAINNEMAGAIITNNYGKIEKYYDENVFSMPNNGKMLRGADAVVADQREFAEKGNKLTFVRYNTMKVTEYGEAVVEIGIYKLTMEVAGKPDPITETGKYLTVWKKYGKSYRIVNDIWNTNGEAKKSKKKPDENRKPKPQDQKDDQKKEEDNSKLEGGGLDSE